MSDFINKFNLIYILIFVLILTSACGGSGNKNPVVIPPPVEKPEITGISVSISGYIFNLPSVNSIKFYKTIESNTPDNSITISNSFYKIDNLPYFPEKMSFSTPAGDNVFINLRKESYELISNTKYTLRQKITLETDNENNNLINYAVLESRENSTTLSRRIMTSIDNLVENNNTIIDLFSKTPFSTISGINSAVKPVVSRRIDLEYGNMITHTIKSFDEVIKNNGENLLETFHTASKTSEQITTLNPIS
ncbi:MAG: hypothetical protein WC337_11610, partial [Candidatus Muiribacteriota bacterium]